MIGRFAIALALLAVCTLTLLGTCTVTAAEPRSELQKMLREVRLPKIRMDDLPIEKALAALQAEAKANDPAGRDVSMVYLPAFNQGIDVQPPLVTMEFDDIPLGETIRYLVQSAGLRYKVDRHAVVVYDKTRSPSAMSLRAFDFPEKWGYFDEDEDEDEPIVSHFGGGDEPDEPAPDKPARDDDDMTDDIVQQFRELGVVFDAAGSVNYSRSTQRLFVYDTDDTHHTISRILEELHHEPLQVRVALTVVEVTDPASLEALPLGELSYKALMQLPPEQRRVLHRSSVLVAPGEEVTVDDSQAATLDGEPVRMHQSATINATIQEDRYTMRLALQWALAIDATGADAGPRMRTALHTTILQYDHEPDVFAVHSQQHGDVRTALYLVLTPILTRPNGRSKRNHHRD